MELSKIGAPPKISTATVSRRRRPESLRGAAETAETGADEVGTGTGDPAGGPVMAAAAAIAAAVIGPDGPTGAAVPALTDGPGLAGEEAAEDGAADGKAMVGGLPESRPVVRDVPGSPDPGAIRSGRPGAGRAPSPESRSCGVRPAARGRTPEEAGAGVEAEVSFSLDTWSVRPAMAWPPSGPASLLLTLLKALKPPRWCGVVLRHCGPRSNLLGGPLLL